MAERATVPVQDVPVDVLTVGGLLDRVQALIGARGRATVAYVNVHVMNVAAEDPALTRFLQGVDCCYADGKGVVWGAALLGHHLPERMTGADWIYGLADRAAQEGWRLAWLGGEPGVSAAAAAALVERFPALQVVATEHGFHPTDGPELQELLDRLNAARPDLLLVGMGTPLQERWVDAHRAQIQAPVVWCVGATADFVSGHVSRGPAFLYNRQEWLARLLVDPRRLWRRFLLGNPRFLGRMIAARLRGP